MKKESSHKFSLWMLAWPIFIEQFLQFLLGAVDTLMVSHLSDDAVAVVGFSNQLFNALTTLFVTVASGAGILIAQKIGSAKEEEARTVGIIGLKATALIGLVLSVVLIAFPGPIARILQLPDELMSLGKIYISIVGGGMILTALIAVLSTEIRSTGNTKAPMLIAVGMNLVHISLNYCFIFGKFGFPEAGLAGVGVSTVTSRLLACIVLFIFFLNAFCRKITFKDLRLFSRRLFKEIMDIGWPLGVNSASWFFSQLVIFAFLAILGAKDLAARTYMNTLESFCFLLGFSVALALQIQVAHLFGGGRTKEAYKASYKGLAIGLPLVTVNALLLVLFGRSMLSLFTDDPVILNIAESLLWLNVLLQPGKMLNMALGNSLNAVGDSRYTMIVSLIVMWTVAVGGSYLFGVSAAWGITAIYSFMIADEYTRGVFAFFRWRGRKRLRMKEMELERESAGLKRESWSGKAGAPAGAVFSAE
ncbi:MATE family efflux transporter [Paenibacillus pinistramenti]|uniref:MATE family efflux transporter n=1 Tax=Paenibacillus pinistramenti TaxID=1768003 RepID=UPI001108C715|nr:MATE family efflux transporter [Paenibacillus pinistramenti]